MKTILKLLLIVAPAVALAAQATGSPETVYVEGGSFRMGEPSANPRQSDPAVTVEAFRITTTEITFDQYDAFARATGRSLPPDLGWGRGKRPVIIVDWHDAIAYSNWLSERDGRTPAYQVTEDAVVWNRSADGWRLPTQEEWEYAAKGGTRSLGTTYAGSNTATDVAWYSANSGGRTHPVAEKQPNELGIYDMSGNVAEWTWDGMGDRVDAEGNPTYPASASFRLVCGGGWNYEASLITVAFFGYTFSDRYNDIGFRLVLPVAEPREGS